MTARDLRPILWRLIRQVGAQGRAFSVEDLRGLLRQPARRERIRDYLTALAAAGYLVPVPAGNGGPVVAWQILRNPGIDAPRVHDDGSPVVQGAGREQCWRAMRILVTFTVDELVASASTPRWAVARGEAEDYCLRLARVGILRRQTGAISRHPDAAGRLRRQQAPTRYTLPPSRYTGPQPPQILRARPARDGQPAVPKRVLDPNTHTLYWPDGRIDQGVRP